MIKKAIAAAFLVAGLSCAAIAQDAKTVIGNASKAMGADNLKTVEYSATGYDFTLGQAYNPNSPWPK